MLKISEDMQTLDKETKATAIEAVSLSKTYKLYRNQKEKIADALGMGRLVYGQKPPDVYTALKDLNFSIGRGEKVGIVGRNGAGKSTLLKLISGLLQPTSGTITIAGSVHMLMYIGLGFHPEFTGRENIKASILYNGLSQDIQEQVELEIAEFAELKEFLDQPVRTYSLGMQSRLQFACATAVKPDILVIDEVLAVGDAYFLAKCIDRINKLVNSGCTLLLVSHSMQHILEFCDRAIWLEQGRITSDGNADIVVDTYNSFMAELNGFA